jgi:hypothetical protein
MAVVSIYTFEEESMLNLNTLEKDHLAKIIRGFENVDKIVQEVVSIDEEHRKKIRRRVEDYLRKCKPEDLGIIVAICGIKTSFTEVK